MPNDVELTAQQIEELARGIVMIADRIADYYKDPANEAAFQEWYLKRYGKPAPVGV